MNVNIQTVHFEADNKLVDYVNKKLSRLDTFHDRIVKVEVYLKLDNVVHTIKDKIAEIKVHVPRQDYFVKCSSKSRPAISAIYFILAAKSKPGKCTISRRLKPPATRATPTPRSQSATIVRKRTVRAPPPRIRSPARRALRSLSIPPDEVIGVTSLSPLLDTLSRALDP